MTVVSPTVEFVRASLFHIYYFWNNFFVDMSQNPGPGEEVVGVGLQGENQQQEVQVLSLENIAAVIKAGVKEVVGEVKENLKTYIEDEFSAAKSKVLESTKYNFKWKGNEVQFNFNSKQKEGVDKAIQ